MPQNKKILIITYYWPPCGGAGVQRWLKFAKYLPEYGWEPLVLTVDPADAQYPAIDESLKKDIDPSLKVFKTRAHNYFILGSGKKTETVAGGIALSQKGLLNLAARFIRGNFFIPDPRKGWNRFALPKAVELIKKEQIKYILTTSPPHSTQLIGLKLKSLFPSVNWICDLRDPWTDIYYYGKFYGTWPAKWYDRKLEMKVLMHADKIITVGKSLAELFALKMNEARGKISVVSNGYDEDDFQGTYKREKEKLKITYVGTLSDQYPVEPLINALSVLQDRNKAYELNIAGQCPAEIKRSISGRLKEDYVNSIPYLSHETAIKKMAGSTVLLLLIPDHKGNELIITGKLYEYLRTGVPILLIGPEDGDAAEIIRENKAGRSFSKTDVEGILNYLSSDLLNETAYELPAKYNRRMITAALSKELEKMTS
ncbi:MAG: glycosyltransferase [Bacteroidales bacterium]|nr:glycosyltransferase [Bacteroidales bacterium]